MENEDEVLVFKTKDEMVAELLEGWQSQSTDEYRAVLRDLFIRRKLYKAYDSMGRAIQQHFGLRHPDNPIYKEWVADGEDTYSPLHPDQVALDLIRTLCVRLFGMIA